MSKIRFYVVCAMAFALFVFLGAVSPKDEKSGTSGVLEHLVMELVAPVQKGFDSVTRSLVSLWWSYLDLIHTEEENRSLKRQVLDLREELNRSREQSIENERLRRLLDFKARMTAPMIPAQVVAGDPSDWFQRIIIDKGSTSGIQQGMAVVSHGGVVGRVILVSPDYSKILLTVDRSSSVTAAVQRNRTRGILVGEGDKMCLLKYVSPSERIEPKDLVITSGLGGVFPKGLALGVVEYVEHRPGDLFQLIRVRPSVDFSTLEEVMVILSVRKALVPEEPEHSGKRNG